MIYQILSFCQPCTDMYTILICLRQRGRYKVFYRIAQKIRERTTKKLSHLAQQNKIG